MKTDPLIWIEANFECMNMSLDDPHQKTLHIKKPTGIGNNIINYPYYENKKLGKHGFIEFF